MMQKPKCPIIALEEHYWDAELAATFTGVEGPVKLGFKGAMIHGLGNGVFMDDKRFWPIYERAEKLDVPIYMHPSLPHPAVMDTYYKEYAKDFPMVVRAAWGYTVETATLAIRLVLGGVFDAYPRLKIVLGHLGPCIVGRRAHRQGADPNPAGVFERLRRDLKCS